MAEKSVRIEPSERAQLMLVGAVAIALVIVGIVVVYNTVLYSDTQSATGTIDSARQAEAFTQQIKHDVRTLAVRLNASNNLSQPNLTSAVRNWSEVQAMSHANTNPVFVDIQPGTCPGNCSPGSRYKLTVVWESEDITFQEQIEVTIPVVGTGSTIYFTNSSGTFSVNGNGSTVTQVATSANASVLGPSSVVLSSGGSVTIPYIDSSGNVKINEIGGSTKTIASDPDVVNQIVNSKSRVAVGSWNGSGPSVFFVNGSGGQPDNGDGIYRATPGGTVKKVASPSPDGAQGIVGIGDIDDDAQSELVFADNNGQFDYLEPNGTVESISGFQRGDNKGIGAGTLVDINGNGVPSVLGVNGSNSITVGGPSSGDGVRRIGPSGIAAKSPLTVADVDSDGDPEIIYLKNNCGSTPKVRYLDKLSGSIKRKDLLNSNGNPVEASCGTGVVS